MTPTVVPGIPMLAMMTRFDDVVSAMTVISYQSSTKSTHKIR